VINKAENQWDLSALPLFAGVSAADIAEIARLATVIHYPTGSTIFAANEPGDALYVVLQGRVDMRCCDRWGHEQTLATLGPGAMLGEIALLTDERRAATAMTVAETTVLRLTNATFMALLKQGGSAGQQLLYNLARGLSGRLGEVTQRLMRLLADQSLARVAPQEDELDELKRKLFTEWKF
jgi:CRP/FNR family cyclic AMP-dependent transcriptional regulator